MVFHSFQQVTVVEKNIPEFKYLVYFNTFTEFSLNTYVFWLDVPGRDHSKRKQMNMKAL